MRHEVTASSALEVCDACEGSWIDWFAGQVHTAAAELEAARLDRGAPPPSRPRAAGVGPRACPRCETRLSPELFRFADARDDELITGVELLRCSECAGAFVPRGSAHLLLDRARQARTQTLWQAVVGLLGRLRTQG